MNKIVALVLLFCIGCSSSKPEIKTIENTTTSSVEAIVEKLSTLAEEGVVEVEDTGNLKVFSCKGCHILCRHCAE